MTSVGPMRPGRLNDFKRFGTFETTRHKKSAFNFAGSMHYLAK